MMKFRYARHTNDLNKLEVFYTTIVGLKKLGSFQGHDGYDGLFIGLPENDWHIEFTTSQDKSLSTFDEDDSLVFYVDSRESLEHIKKRILQNEITLQTPKNPYWVENGLMIVDPDGCNVVFTVSTKKK